MNPFDLSGPPFLLFYIVLAVIVIIALKLVIDEAESGPARALPLSDPYQIAWLRGGTPEAARIAVLSLSDRGLLAVSGNDLVTASAASLASVQQPIERAILACCGHSGTAATAVLDDRAVERACAPFRARLERLQLMPDAAMRARRYRWFAVAAAILLCVAIAKIVVAFGRGRYNVGFLIILAAIGLLLVWLLVRRPRTYLGNRMLKDLRRPFWRAASAGGHHPSGVDDQRCDAIGGSVRHIGTALHWFRGPPPGLQEGGELGERVRIGVRLGLRRRRWRWLRRMRRQLSAATGSGSAGVPSSPSEYLRISTGST